MTRRLMSLRPTFLIAVLALTGVLLSTAGCESSCERPEPEVRLEIRFADAEFRRQVSAFRYRLRVDAIQYEPQTRALDTNGPLTESALITINDTLVADRFIVGIDIELLSGPDEIVVGRSSATMFGGRTSCDNLLVAYVGQSYQGDAGDTGPQDIGPTDNDAGEVAVALRAEPSRLSERWVDRGEELTFQLMLIADGESLDLSTLSVTSTRPDWLSIDIGAAIGNAVEVTVTIDTTEPGLPVNNDTVIDFEAEGRSVSVPLAFRLFTPVHVGPTPSQCPHQLPDGSPSSTCAYTGVDGIRAAVAGVPPYAHIIVHNDDGAPFEYRGTVTISQITWLSSVATADPSTVVLRQPVACAEVGVVNLGVSGIRVEGFTLVSAFGCFYGISTWPNGEPENGTHDHEIRRMIITALRPEIYDVNGIVYPFALSETTTVANSHIYGFWEGIGDLSHASGSVLAHNTFVFFQRFGKPVPGSFPGTANVRGTDGVQVVNNVFVTPSPAIEPLLTGDSSTRNLVVRGNAYKGFSNLQTTEFRTPDPSNDIEIGPPINIDLKSPYAPQFLTDATRPSIFGGVPLSGTSLDGVAIVDGVAQGLAATVPGAFQQLRDGPVTTSIRLGPDTCTDCDLVASSDNEVQLAVWNLWAGGRLEVLPGRYAGNALVTWPIEIAGAGTSADQVVFESRFENALWSVAGLFDHNALLAATQDADPGLLVENIQLEMSNQGPELNHGIFLEGTLWNGGQQIVRQVIVRHTGTPTIVPQAAIVVGSRSLIQDSLIQGPWNTCAAGHFDPTRILFFDNIELINVTCRLTGGSQYPVDGALRVSRVRSGRLYNLLLSAEPATAGPVFYGPGEVSMENPIAFEARAVHYRGFGTLTAPEPLPSAVLDVEALNEPQTFVSDTDSSLVPGAASRNSGIQPSAFGSTWTEGRGLNGTARGDDIDRGAYEQP